MNRLLRLLLGCALLSLLAAPPVSADREADWQSLRRQFRELPIEARRLTGPLFWLHGDESAERLRMYLDKVVEGGNGSFCAESRPHNDWLGPGWFRDLQICLDEAKKHDLQMWIFDERWWPSQTIAGNVPQQFAAKVLTASSETIEGPRRVREEDIEGATFIVMIAGRESAEGVDPESLVDLVAYIRKGVLEWDVPPGRWKLMRFSWELAPAAAQGGRLTVDGASRDCVDWFLRTVYEPHWEHFGEDFGETIVGFFYDEPETQGDWGTELPRVLLERGIDWKQAYVAWKFRLAGDAQAAGRYAYMDALTETWGRTMYGGISRWCEERGVVSIGHFIEHDGWYLRPGHGAANLFQMQKYSAMGGMDLVCQQLWPGERKPGIYQIPKLTSSISHAYGKTDDLAMCEIYGAYGQALTYPQMKWLVDHHQVRGVNFMITHSFNPRAPNDTDCPPYFFNGGEEPRWPLYRVWADYSSRLSLMLSGGRHVCPVGVLFCGASAYAGEAVTPEAFTGALQDALYDCDWIPYEVFESDGKLSGAELRLHAERYRVLVVPPVEVIPVETLEKVREFWERGGAVIAYGFLPTRSATLGRSSTEVRRLGRAVWGVPKPGSRVCKISSSGGRSYFLPLEPGADEVAAVLADAGIDPVVKVTAGDTDGWVHALHRVKNGRDMFFICNQDHDGPVKNLTLRLKGDGAPELWDAMTGAQWRLPYRRMGNEGVEIDLALEPSESALVVLSGVETRLSSAITQEMKHAREPVVLRKKIRAREDELTDLSGSVWIWTDELDGLLNAAPGERFFRRDLHLPLEAGVQYARALISVDNDFVLYVNGQDAGRSGGLWNSWQRPATIDIGTLLRPGKNVLAVEATNTTDKPSPAGIIAHIVVALDDGRFVELRTDADWRWAAEVAGDWHGFGFEDADWKNAVEIARFGDGPWGRLYQNGAILPADPLIEDLSLMDGDLANSRVCLEMEGLYQDGASVRVNGKYAGGLIGRPFRLDLTHLVRSGKNLIVVEPYAPDAASVVFYASDRP